MSQGKHFSIRRRELLAAGAGLAVLAAMPVSAKQALSITNTSAGNSSRLQAWVRRLDPAHSSIKATGNVSTEQSIQLVFRGPYCAAAPAERANLKVGLVYRAVPHQPFELLQGMDCVGQGGCVVHASPESVAGLRLQLADVPEDCGIDCPLDDILHPGLSPGRYAVLINSGRWRLRPDWSLVDSSSKVTGPNLGLGPQAWKHWSLLSLDVLAA